MGTQGGQAREGCEKVWPFEPARHRGEGSTKRIVARQGKAGQGRTRQGLWECPDSVSVRRAVVARAGCSTPFSVHSTEYILVRVKFSKDVGWARLKRARTEDPLASHADRGVDTILNLEVSTN